MTPSEIGERAEIAVMAALACAGKQVLVPFGGHHRFDIAFEEDGCLVKVQCKTGRKRGGVVEFATADKTLGVQRDYREDADLFGVYCHERHEVYLVPVAEVPRRGASLRLTPPRNNQKAGIRMAAQYLIRDGRLPDAVDQALEALTPAGSTRGHIRGNRPSRITSSSILDRQMSMFECTLGSTNIDIEGDPMPTIELEVAGRDTPVACCSPLAATALSDDEAQATATLFKALGDPHRVRIVNLLANSDEPVCVCELTPHLDLSQPTVSFHLKKLVSSGLLHREQRGTWAYYSINPDAMKTLTGVVELKGTR